MKKTIVTILVAGLVMACLGGCKKGASDPEVITLWHVYGGQADSPLNDLINEYNETEGKEKNIKVQVTSVTNTNTIHENVLAAAFNDPGASELPDMFVSYPKTVLAMPDEDVLVDYNDYFTEEELEEFIPAFIEEGMINDKLRVLPVAKSTEILFVNKTAFDRFAADTGVKMEDMATWEGLFDMMDSYYEWTDAKTPDIENDGKVFLAHDYHFNYFQVGTESLGEDFFTEDNLAFGTKFRRAWDLFAGGAIKGGVWLQSGYGTEPLRTGDAIAIVGSSASVLYYSNLVTYPDNTSEEVEIVAMPCPVFEGGNNLVMQRGAGICTVRSTPEKEKACISFLKWLTDARHNVDFVTQLGYMPVKQESFDKYLIPAFANLEDPMYKSLYEAFIYTQKNYEFYTAPKMQNYLELETKFEEQIRLSLQQARHDYLEDLGTVESETEDALEEFQSVYME